MEDNRNDLIVIVAGYTKPMEQFISSNSGLESRFNRFLHFPDYSVDELLAILHLKAKQSGYELSEDAIDSVKSMLALGALTPESFGNARGVRNILEHAVSAQANRLSQLENITKEDLLLLTREDFQPQL